MKGPHPGRQNGNPGWHSELSQGETNRADESIDEATETAGCHRESVFGSHQPGGDEWRPRAEGARHRSAPGGGADVAERSHHASPRRQQVGSRRQWQQGCDYLKTIGGRSCLYGDLFAFDIDDRYAFDVDEPVDVTVMYAPDLTQPFTVAWDQNAGNGYGVSELVTPEAGA